MNWLWLLFLFGLGIAASIGTTRPLATAAGWLILVGALVVWWALTPPVSPRGIPWSVLLMLLGLGCVAWELASRGRALEIALWVPAIAGGLVGWVYVLVALMGGAPRPARIAQGVLATILLGVPLTLWATVGDFTGLALRV